MKKIAAILTICTLSAMTFAQEKQKGERVSPEKKHEMKMEKMESELNLTPEQKQKIEAIEEKYAPIQKEQKIKQEALRSEMKETKTQKREEIKALLTPEQLKLMEEKKENKKEQMKEHKKKHEHPMKAAPKK